MRRLVKERSNHCNQALSNGISMQLKEYDHSMLLRLTSNFPPLFLVSFHFRDFEVEWGGKNGWPLTLILFSNYFPFI